MLKSTAVNIFTVARRFPRLFHVITQTSQILAKHLFEVMQQEKEKTNVKGEGLSQMHQAEQTAHNMMELLGYKKKDLYCADKVEPILAAIFHNIGHFCSHDAFLEHGCLDRKHKKIGAQFLLNHGLSPRVAGLVESDTEAKRYLAASEPGYLKGLSPTSLRALESQGGPMPLDECRNFENSFDFKNKILLRKAYETAKNSRSPVPSLQEYQKILEQYLISRFISDPTFIENNK